MISYFETASHDLTARSDIKCTLSPKACFLAWVSDWPAPLLTTRCDWPYHHLPGSKDPQKEGQLGKKKGSWSPGDPTKRTNDEPGWRPDFGPIVDPFRSPKKQWPCEWKRHNRGSPNHFKEDTPVPLPTRWWRPSESKHPRWRLVFSKLHFATLPNQKDYIPPRASAHCIWEFSTTQGPFSGDVCLPLYAGIPSKVPQTLLHKPSPECVMACFTFDKDFIVASSDGPRLMAKAGIGVDQPPCGPATVWIDHLGDIL